MASSIEPRLDVIAEKRRFWDSVISECNHLLGPAPRRFSLWERWLRSKMPSWAYKDPIRRMEARKWSVLSTGAIVWGYVVQANVSAFSLGTESAPADILFSPYPSLEVNPEYLKDMAVQLYELKTDPPESEKGSDFYKHIRNDLDRADGVPCPIENNHNLMVSTILIDRSDLPYGFLLFSYFPVAVFPDGTVSVVPKKYWPKTLIQHWAQNCHPHLKWKGIGQHGVQAVGSIFYVQAIVMLLVMIAAVGYAVETSR